MRANTSREIQSQSGQTLVLYALMIVGMLAIAALVVDFGLVYGQRRFDQNGADAAALAAARHLAKNVSLLNDGTLYFMVDDEQLYTMVLSYAGLGPNPSGGLIPTGTNIPNPGVPNGTNQNPGLGGRNNLAVTLEYSADGVNWCYSRASTTKFIPSHLPSPYPRPSSPVCPANSGVLDNLVPMPSTSSPFRVRVTVSSSTDMFFAPLPGIDAGNAGPGVPTSQADPACYRADATGVTTCAHAVAAVTGVLEYAGPGNMLPVTNAWCEVGTSSKGELYELWGSNTSTLCGGPGEPTYRIGPWSNILDFTKEENWRNGQPEEYGFYNLLPHLPPSRVPEAYTPLPWDYENPTTPDGWYHYDTNLFQYDTSHPGISDPDTDVPYWIAKTFSGPVVAYEDTELADGTPKSVGDPAVRLPTYPKAGNMGNNVALGFYCSGSGTPTDTSCIGPPSNTYFFAEPATMIPCPADDYFQGLLDLDDPGSAMLGCRDATVLLWDNPEEVKYAGGPNTGGIKFDPLSGNKQPDRVRIYRKVMMRFYCETDPSTGFCTDRPNQVGAAVGQNTSNNSSVWGRFLTKVVNTCADAGGCSSSVSIKGNVAYLER